MESVGLVVQLGLAGRFGTWLDSLYSPAGGFPLPAPPRWIPALISALEIGFERSRFLVIRPIEFAAKEKLEIVLSAPVQDETGGRGAWGILPAEPSQFRSDIFKQTPQERETVFRDRFT